MKRQSARKRVLDSLGHSAASSASARLQYSIPLPTLGNPQCLSGRNARPRPPNHIYHVIYIALVGVPEALRSFNDRLTAVSPAILQIEDDEVLRDKDHSERLDGNRGIQAGQVSGRVLLTESVGRDDAAAAAASDEDGRANGAFQLAH